VIAQPPPVGSLLGEARFTDIDPEFLLDLRGWLDQPLRDHPPDTVRTVAVVLGELVANAFRHATPPFAARLTLPPPSQAICVEVHDSTPTTAVGWPLRRGLLIVRDLCPDWGVEHRPPGKIVWAEIPVPLTVT
jgi:hypothetical protein